MMVPFAPVARPCASSSEIRAVAAFAALLASRPFVRRLATSCSSLSTCARSSSLLTFGAGDAADMRAGTLVAALPFGSAAAVAVFGGRARLTSLRGLGGPRSPFWICRCQPSCLCNAPGGAPGLTFFWRGVLGLCALRGTRHGLSSGRLQTGCIGHLAVSCLLSTRNRIERSTPERADGPSIDDEAAANLAFADEDFA